MKVKIFTVGGSGIGLGHVSRCSAIYDEVASRGIEVEFIIHGNIENIDFLKGRNFKNINWLSEEFLNNYINYTDYCIEDSYLASVNLYHIISNKSKKALFLDDNARIRYPKGIIVNPSLSVDNLYYHLTDENIYLLGAKYIVLRSPFVNVERRSINQDVKNVLITMGGSDIRDLTPKILNGICRKYPEVKFNVVIGNAFDNVKRVERIKLSNVELLYNIAAESMKKLMLESDFAITAAGQTIYELLATQTPFIPIKVIDNQINNVKGLRKINPTQSIIEYSDDELLIKELEKEFKIILSQVYRQTLVNTYKNQVDGLGSRRILDTLLEV